MPSFASPAHGDPSGRVPRRILLALWTAAALLACAEAQPAGRDPVDAAAARLVQEALRSDEAYALVSSLTTEVGPRFAGTPGEQVAQAWAGRQLARLGFSRIRKAEVFVPRWVRGDASFAVLEPFAQSMPVLALGGSVGTAAEGLTGEIVAVPDLEALRALPDAAVQGRIVFFTRRTERSRDISRYRVTVRARTEGASAAAARGATGVVIRSIGTSQERLPHTGTVSYHISQPRIPAVALSNPDADSLERQLATGRKVVVNLRVTARDLPQVRSANVIAEFPGTDLADEIVLVGAHLDSWDVGVGALDDGAGVAIAMSAARLASQARPRPRRTIRVVLFANEEFGLSGAARYPVDEGDGVARHAVAMEADSGAGPVWRLGGQLGAANWPLLEKIHRIVAPLGVELGDAQVFGGADLQPLRRLGVPVLAPELDASRYFDVHHSDNDTLDKVDPGHLRQSVAVFAVSAYLAAMAPQAFERLPMPAAR
jgi:carboxypeptidase Q